MRSVLRFILAAALLPGAAAASPPGEDGGISAPQPVSPAPKASAGSAVERHSPRDGSPFLGKAEAGNTLTFFIDYQCPVCPRAAREMSDLVASFAGALKVEVKHNPLAMHRQALDAAAAGRAAQRQGKFWEYHDLLLDSRSFDRDALFALAERIGLDREAFRKDFEDPALREGLLEEAREAERVGATSTPGFLINGHAESGWASLAYLRGIIQRHLK